MPGEPTNHLALGAMVDRTLHKARICMGRSEWEALLSQFGVEPSGDCESGLLVIADTGGDAVVSEGYNCKKHAQFLVATCTFREFNNV